MNVTRLDGDAAAAPADATTGPQSDRDVRHTMRAAPDYGDDDQQAEEPAEEPGYGHGV